MPTYTYQCEACSHVQEQFHGMSESPRFACPQCGGLTRKVPEKPTVLKQEIPPETPPAQESHGSNCALHHYHPHGGCQHD